MDWTDRHCRYFHRLLSPSCLLYTEMVTTGALIHGDRPRHLDFSKEEHPLVLQLGGSVPDDLAVCAKIAQDWGYDGINLNVGCPSDRVQNGNFGACLMAEPELVADCVKAMQAVVEISVTVKTRIGIDECDENSFLRRFVKIVHERGGCTSFIIHARKAWLQGLSPKENRTVPPLNYDLVYQIKQEWPDLHIGINGGFTDLEAVKTALQHVDHVMIGRAAYQDPWFLTQLETEIMGAQAPQTREDVLTQMKAYSESLEIPWRAVRHMMGLYNGQTGAKAWRRQLGEMRCL